MTRIEKKFQSLKSENRKALITFIMAGDPDISSSAETLKSLPGAGADIIEIGMPFTDPMADGPVIQAAGLRALKSETKMAQIFEMLQDFRQTDAKTPIVLMGYFNPVFAYGIENFMRDAAKAGVDGLILVDLPPEEMDEIEKDLKAHNIDLIRLITPTTDEARLEKILRGASGFLYYVSIAGITGAAKAKPENLKAHLEMIKDKTDLPIAIGFGIKTPQDVADFASIADGVVVGSAIVQTIEQEQDVDGYVKTLAGAL